MRTLATRWPLILLLSVAVVSGALLWSRTRSAAAATGATITVSDNGPHAVGETFPVTVVLSNVTFDSTSPSWFGYDMELDYSTGVLQANNVTPTLCPPARWSSASLSPAVVTGCSLTTGSTQAGLLETISFTCLTNGTTLLHLPPHHAGSSGPGNALFDGNAVDFPMTLNDATVTCGTGVNDPTFTPTPVPATPTPTSTPDFFGRATFDITSGGTHAVGESFTVDVNLSSLELGTAAFWAGFDLSIGYDSAVIRPTSATPGLCQPPDWVPGPITPRVNNSCVVHPSTATGTLVTITFDCVGTGASPLTFGPFDTLFDSTARSFAMTMNGASATCVPGTPTVPASPTTVATPTATPTSPIGLGLATFRLRTPGAAAALNMPFIINSELATFTPGGSTTWAGYDVTLAYDPAVIRMLYAAPTLCLPRSHWALVTLAPQVKSGCFGLSSTGIGALETIVAMCVGDGTSPLHFVLGGPAGSTLFDRNAFSFTMTFQDASVTCDQHVDDDMDGCGTSREAALGLDAANPWDFFSVPVPALISAADPRLIFKDRGVSAQDAQAVFAYFKAGASVGKQVYEQDLNGNGVKDGLEYDRSFVGPRATGAPDGSVSATDAQLAFAQFKAGYTC